WLEERVLLSGGLRNTPGLVTAQNAPFVLPASVMYGAVPIAMGSAVSGNLTQGGADFYQIQPNSNGRLIAQPHPHSNGPQLRLALFDGQGNLLVESDGQSIGRLDPLIDQHVSGGISSTGLAQADFLEVQSRSGAGSYSLSTSLVPATDPGQTLALPANFQN